MLTILTPQTFEKEQSLEDLIRQTVRGSLFSQSCSSISSPFRQTHEIELSENLEKNEAHERAILRSQSATQGAFQLNLLGRAVLAKWCAV